MFVHFLSLFMCVCAHSCTRICIFHTFIWQEFLSLIHWYTKNLLLSTMLTNRPFHVIRFWGCEYYGVFHAERAKSLPTGPHEPNRTLLGRQGGYILFCLWMSLCMCLCMCLSFPLCLNFTWNLMSGNLKLVTLYLVLLPSNKRYLLIFVSTFFSRAGWQPQGFW